MIITIGIILYALSRIRIDVCISIHYTDNGSM
jgi:hypothetical protein